MNDHLVIWFVGIAAVSYVAMCLRSLRKSLTKQCCYKCFKFWFELLKLWLNQIDDFKVFLFFVLITTTLFPAHNFNISTMVPNETSASNKVFCRIKT